MMSLCPPEAFNLGFKISHALAQHRDGFAKAGNRAMQPRACRQHGDEWRYELCKFGK